MGTDPYTDEGQGSGWKIAVVVLVVLCAALSIVASQLWFRVGRLERQSGLDFADDEWADRRAVDKDAIARIVLPENATREQVVQYVRDLLDASRDQHSWSTMDPQVAKLVAVGPEHADVLIDAMKPTLMDDLYLVAALKQTVREEHKDTVLDRLPEVHALAEVVVEKGWSKDAKDILLDELAIRPSNLPTEWIDAAANVAEPQQYPDLLHYLSHGTNPSCTYAAIRNLPGIDPEDALLEAWYRVRDNSYTWDRDSLAPYVVEWGQADALADCIHLLRDGEDYQKREVRRAILAHTEGTGSNPQLIRWYEENKGRLFWDKESRRFPVGEGRGELGSRSVLLLVLLLCRYAFFRNGLRQ